MKNKIETFAKEHPVASGFMVAATTVIVYQRTQIKALSSFADFLIHEVK